MKSRRGEAEARAKVRSGSRLIRPNTKHKIRRRPQSLINIQITFILESRNETLRSEINPTSWAMFGVNKEFIIRHQFFSWTLRRNFCRNFLLRSHYFLVLEANITKIIKLFSCLSRARLRMLLIHNCLGAKCGFPHNFSSLLRRELLFRHDLPRAVNFRWIK